MFSSCCANVGITTVNEPRNAGGMRWCIPYYALCLLTAGRAILQLSIRSELFTPLGIAPWDPVSQTHTREMYCILSSPSSHPGILLLPQGLFLLSSYNISGLHLENTMSAAGRHAASDGPITPAIQRSPHPARGADGMGHGAWIVPATTVTGKSQSKIR